MFYKLYCSESSPCFTNESSPGFTSPVQSRFYNMPFRAALTIRRITFNLTGENRIFLKFLTSTLAVPRHLSRICF